MASLALPNWTDHSLREQRAEALDSLRIIGELQVDFYAKHQKYSDSYSELDFSPAGYRRGSSLRGDHYTYELAAWQRDGGSGWNYRATATANLDASDAILDIIILENGLTVDGRLNLQAHYVDRPRAERQRWSVARAKTGTS